MCFSAFSTCGGFGGTSSCVSPYTALSWDEKLGMWNRRKWYLKVLFIFKIAPELEGACARVECSGFHVSSFGLLAVRYWLIGFSSIGYWPVLCTEVAFGWIYQRTTEPDLISVGIMM
jgi:hypothetical protein